MRLALASMCPSPEHTRCLRRLTALSALASALFSPPAAAQTTYSAGGGIFLGYAWGQQPGIHWGVELYGHQVTPSQTYNCGVPLNRSPRTAVGPLLQFGATGGGSPRLTLAVHGARELRFDGMGLGGEVGATYRFGERAGWGVHTGLVPTLGLFNTALRAEWLLDEYSLVAGARAPKVFDAFITDYCSVPGRPLRDARGQVKVIEHCHGLRSVQGGPSSRVSTELASAWERDAQYECASIPAFLELAETLLEQGAPADLVEHALEAASDEIRHALLCGELAQIYGGRTVQLTLPLAHGRPALEGVEALKRLAVESWLDGCLGEGQAAEVARAGAAGALDVRACRAQTTIAHDERRHAELAWDILAWALARGGEPVRAAVAAHRDVCMATPSAELAPEGFGAFGRIDALRMHAISEQHLAASQERLAPLVRG